MEYVDHDENNFERYRVDKVLQIHYRILLLLNSCLLTNVKKQNQNERQNFKFIEILRGKWCGIMYT